MGFSVIPEPAISGFTGPQGPAGTIPSDPVFTGSMAVNDTSGDPNIDIKKNGSMRWKVRSAGSETGSNNGSDLWVEAFADDGTTKIGDPIWISRTLGQVSIGIANSTQSGVALSVNGAIGTRDIAADPATTTMGAQLYSKAGKLWVQTASGAEKFQVVNSVAKAGNSQIDGQYVWLNTAAGTYRAFGYKTAGVDRWLFQVDDAAESGSNAGSNFRLSARNDDGSFNKTTVYASRATGQITFGTTVLHGDAQTTSASAIGIRDQAADPTTTTGGVFLYSKGGLAYVKQGDGTVFQLAAGGGTGAVSSVNGYTGTVSLAASDVGALPIAGGTVTGPTIIQPPTSGHGLTVYGSTDPATYFRVTDQGHPYSNSLRPTFYNLGVGDTGTPFAGGKFMLGIKNASILPTSDPVNGVVAYSEAGVLKVRQSNGTIVTVQNAPDLTNYVQNNGSPTFNDFMIINASAATNYGTVALRKLNKKRWSFAVTGASETGSDVGSNFIIQSYTDAEADKTYHFFADRASGSTTIGSTQTMNGARLAVDGGALGIVNQAADPTTSSLGAQLYSKSGRPWVQRSSGATPGGAVNWEIKPRPSEFLPEDLGLLAWTSDPMDCISTGNFTGTTSARVSAVYLREPQSVSKIVWHFTGYAGGLLAGSWAAIYNSSGTRMAYNDSIQTGTNEPAEQHGLGGGASYVPVTATTLSAGLYYIVWRFNYTASPADGPMCLQYENSAGAPPGTFGLNSVKRFGVLDATSQTTSFTSLTVANIQNGANRFWAALA